MIGAQSVMSLYRIDFPNGKSYVGVTGKSVRARFIQHCKLSAKENPVHAVHRALKQHGIDRVEVNELVRGRSDYILEMEKSAIRAFATKTPNGYNMTDGGDGVINVSAESREKLRAANTGKRMSDTTKGKLRAHNTGKTLSLEHRRKISEAQKGKIISKESIEKMKSAAIGRSVSESAKRKISKKLIGKSVSASTREKLSKALRGRKHDAEFSEKCRVRATGLKQSAETIAKRAESIRRWHAEKKNVKQSESAASVQSDSVISTSTTI